MNRRAYEAARARAREADRARARGARRRRGAHVLRHVLKRLVKKFGLRE